MFLKKNKDTKEVEKQIKGKEETLAPKSESQSPVKPTTKLVDDKPKEEKTNIPSPASTPLPQTMHMAGMPMHPMGHNMQANMGQLPHPMAIPFMGQMMMMVPQMGMPPHQFMMHPGQPMSGGQNFAPMMIPQNDKDDAKNNNVNDKKQDEIPGMAGIPVMMHSSQFMQDFNGIN